MTGLRRVWNTLLLAALSPEPTLASEPQYETDRAVDGALMCARKDQGVDVRSSG